MKVDWTQRNLWCKSVNRFLGLSAPPITPYYLEPLLVGYLLGYALLNGYLSSVECGKRDRPLGKATGMLSEHAGMQ